MQRSDAIATVALVVAAVAFFYKPAIRELPEPPPPPDTHLGDLYLEPQGAGACKLQRKSPDPIVVHDGDWVFWTVHNNCEQEVRLEVVDRKGKPGNRSKDENPLSAVLGSAIPAKSDSAVIAWLVKTQDDLKPGAGNTKDKWTFKWKLNNATQQDPEIEIEYRRKR